MKLSRFGEGLGLWELKIEEIEYKLKPTMDDVLELRKAMAQASNRRTGVINLEVLDNAVFSIFERLVIKAEPNLSLEEKKQLKEYIVINLGSITDEMLIALKQTSKEAMDKAKAEMLEEETDSKKKQI